MRSTEHRGGATQISSRRFDQRFFSLPPEVQDRIQTKIDDMGNRLGSFAHHRMEGMNTYRLRIGDYRVIYSFDIARNELALIALGHRRDIYKK